MHEECTSSPAVEGLGTAPHREDSVRQARWNAETTLHAKRRVEENEEEKAEEKGNEQKEKEKNQASVMPSVLLHLGYHLVQVCEVSAALSAREHAALQRHGPARIKRGSSGKRKAGQQCYCFIPGGFITLFTA